MKTTEDLFQEAIAQYQIIINEATLLNENMHDLAPDEILQSCTRLQKRQHKQVLIDKFIIDIMNDHGSQILEQGYVGEYQRALDRAISCCNEVSLQAKQIRAVLKQKKSSNTKTLH